MHYGTSSRGNLINIDCQHCWRRSVRFETRLNNKRIILFRSILGRTPGIRFVCRPPSICVDFPILHFALEWNFPLWRQLWSQQALRGGRERGARAEFHPPAKKTKMSRLRYHWLELDFLAIVELLFVETLHLIKLETEADEVAVAPRGHVWIPKGWKCTELWQTLN